MLLEHSLLSFFFAFISKREHKWKATLPSASFFAELLHTETNKLSRRYNHKIDGLDFQCVGIAAEKFVPVDGSIGQASCESCGENLEDFDQFCKEVCKKIKDVYNQEENAPKESTRIKLQIL